MAQNLALSALILVTLIPLAAFGVLGLAAVVVTHELDSAFKIADRITVLDRGAILMSDTTAAVRASAHPRIRALLDRTPRHDAVDADAYMARLTRELF